MLLTLLLLIVGVALLFLSGNYLVKHAVLLAKETKVSPLVIGLTIVAFGTSAPELIVSSKAAFDGYPDIAIGNIIGSNIANIFLVLGTASMVYPVTTATRVIKREGLTLIAATVLFAIMCLFESITLTSGLILVSAIIVFILTSIYMPDKALKELSIEQVAEFKEDSIKSHSVSYHIMWLIGSLIVLAIGSELFLQGAVGIGRTLGISEAVIGLTIVAVATASPEIVTSMIAAYQKHTDVALGNIIGSNIFNILAIPGISAMITPIKVNPQFIEIDLVVLFSATLGLVIYGYFNQEINRKAGTFMVCCYGGYAYHLFSTL